MYKNNHLQESYNYHVKIHKVMVDAKEEFREKKKGNESPTRRNKKRVEWKLPLLRNQTLIEQPFRLHSVYTFIITFSFTIEYYLIALSVIISPSTFAYTPWQLLLRNQISQLWLLQYRISPPEGSKKLWPDYPLKAPGFIKKPSRI